MRDHRIVSDWARGNRGTSNAHKQLLSNRGANRRKGQTIFLSSMEGDKSNAVDAICEFT